MTKEQYFKMLETIFQEGLNLMKLKNADYAGKEDPFKNFRLCEQLGVPLEQGVLVRMSDKLARAGNLLKNEASVSSESIHDTLIDLMNYSAILMVWMDNKEFQDIPPLKTPFIAGYSQGGGGSGGGVMNILIPRNKKSKKS